MKDCVPGTGKDTNPSSLSVPLRALFLVFFESGHKSQRRQKRGLREALEAHGKVVEIDYREEFRRHGRESALRKIAQAANDFQPDLVLSEIYRADVFFPENLVSLRKRIPEVTW